jgi:outer membrane lipoprotein-sorting protein
MTMTCEEIKNRIVERILSVSAGGDPMMDEHLRACDDCRRFADHVRVQQEQLQGLAQTMDSRIRDNQARILEQLNGLGQVHPSPTIPIWRKIMKNRLSQLSVAAAMIIAVSLLLHWFFAAGSSVAFAEVLNKMRGSSYTFDLQFTVPSTAAAGKPIKGSILEPGRMRLDCAPMPGLGAISSIIDVQSGRCLILFHQQKAAELLTNPVPSRNAGGGGFATLITGPVKELWNLRDGKEKSLGKKTLDGVEAEGFEVQIKDEGDIPREQLLHYNIRIWADAKTAAPVLVEIATLPLDSSQETIEWSMSHFQLDVPLDESLFRMEPPADYTLSHQKDLTEVVAKTTGSPQGKIIVEAVELASQKKLDEAIAKLLTVDWNKPVAFEGTAYIFTMSEKQYITLKPDDQQKMMQKVLDDAAAIKQIARTLREKAVPMIEARQYDKAETMLKAGERVGRLLTDDPERMILVRLVGIAVQKMMLDDLGKLYESQGKADLLQKARQRLQAVQAEGDAIKKAATGK